MLSPSLEVFKLRRDVFSEKNLYSNTNDWAASSSNWGTLIAGAESFQP